MSKKTGVEDIVGEPDGFEKAPPGEALSIPHGEAALVSDGTNLRLYIPVKGGNHKISRFLAAVGVLWSTDQEFVDNVLKFFEENKQ